MRSTSIRLYGELCARIQYFKVEVDMSLLHNNLVTLLMHLCENDKNIVKVGIYMIGFAR